MHKVVDVWIEDFRPANGIFDQYFGFKLQDPSDPKIRQIIEYAHKVLDATGVKNGATNTEVKWIEAENQPCLVEVNARWAGMNWHDGLAVENVCMGNNQITATFTSYLDADGFDKMPVFPIMKLWGASIATINYVRGKVRGLPGLVAAKQYPSYYDSDVDCPGSSEADLIGRFLDKTNPDCIPVRIAFVGKDRSVVMSDYNRVINLEYKGKFFDLQPIDETSPPNLSAADNKPATRASLVYCAALVGCAVCAMMLAAVIRSRREKSDGTEYYIVVE